MEEELDSLMHNITAAVVRITHGPSYQKDPLTMNLISIALNHVGIKLMLKEILLDKRTNKLLLETAEIRIKELELLERRGE